MEFALVSSLIIVVAWGVIQFGIAINRQQGLQAAGREGARYAASSQATIGEIQTKVKQGLAEVLDTGSTTFVDPCPSDPTTLATGKFCVNVLRRDSAGSAPVLLSGAGTRPCNLAHGKNVIVSVYHRMPITIPLWAAGSVNVTGAGEFKCET